MSIYLHRDGEAEGVQVASSGGWSDVLDWADNLPTKHYSAIGHLLQHGWTEDISDAERQLDEAIKFYAPDDEETLSTLNGLSRTLNDNVHADVVNLSNGISADDDQDEEEHGDDDEATHKAIGDLATILPQRTDSVDVRQRKERNLLLLLLAFWTAQKEEILSGIDPDNHQPITNKPEWDAKLSAALLGGMIPVGIASAAQSARDAGLTVPARDVNAAVQDSLQDVADKFAPLINQTTVDNVNDAIAGVANGAANADDLLRSAIDNVFDIAEETRGPVIADDGAYIADQAGTVAPAEVANEAAEEEGDDETPSPPAVTAEWVTAEDDRVCSICGPLDGRVVIAGTEFAPNLFLPTVDTHPRCRCRIVIGTKPANYPPQEEAKPETPPVKEEGDEG